MLYKLAKPLLFSLNPELAHRLSVFSFSHVKFPRSEIESPELQTKLFHLNLKNPLGLAAGFDKNGEAIVGLSSLGFGFLTIGSVMAQPNVGNPSPRLRRYEEEEALVNSLGLPSKGVAYVARHLAHAPPTPLIVSIAGFRTEDYSRCIPAIEPWADLLEINLSSPTFHLKGTAQSDPETAYDIVRAVVRVRRHAPLLAKLPPASSSAQLKETVERVTKAGADGFTATNTLPGKCARLATGAGGMSGRPLHRYSVATVKEVYEITGGRMPIVGTGGVFTAHDVFQMIASGASCVALYTALVYRGPGIVREIIDGLRKLLKRNGLSTLDELRGSAVKH